MSLAHIGKVVHIVLIKVICIAAVVIAWLVALVKVQNLPKFPQDYVEPINVEKLNRQRIARSNALAEIKRLETQRGILQEQFYYYTSHPPTKGSKNAYYNKIDSIQMRIAAIDCSIEKQKNRL